MDACDELGLFVIVATPGWQYWNKDPKFGELVHQNTREMIRRDRNHPSVLMWEPILNETRYPLDFALKALENYEGRISVSGTSDSRCRCAFCRCKGTLRCSLRLAG